MNKKNSDIQGFDYPELDLSDQQPPKKQENDKQPTGQPTKKNKTDQSISKTNQVQAKTTKTQKQSFNPNQASKTPLPFFPPPPGGLNKGGSVWVPPPPVAQKTSQSQSQQSFHRPQFQKNQFVQNRDNRQKKNTVYVKNIPKSFNTQDKLMTFFKNEGPIKQIKVNQTEQSAVIRFVKQENTAKFLKSNKIIFNRSYIVYGQNENLTVSPQQVTDRTNDEMGNVKKAQQTNLKVVKEKISNELAQNIRAIYFLQTHLVEEESEQTKILRNQLIHELESKVEGKRILQIGNNQEFKSDAYNTSNYNWTLIFERKSSSGIDKKSLFSQFLKYGPIVAIQYECLSQKQAQNQGSNQNEQQNQNAGKSTLDYKIKVLYLGIKHAWAVYHSRKDETGTSVEGDQLQKYFTSGKLKIVELKKTHQIETGSHHLANEQKLQENYSQVIAVLKELQDQNAEAVQNEQLADNNE